MEETIYMEDNGQQEMFPEENTEVVDGFEVVAEAKGRNAQNDHLKEIIIFLSGLTVGAAGAWWVEYNKRKFVLKNINEAAELLAAGVRSETIEVLDLAAIQKHINQKVLVRRQWFEFWKISAGEQYQWSKALAKLVSSYNIILNRTIESEPVSQGHIAPDEQN